MSIEKLYKEMTEPNSGSIKAIVLGDNSKQEIEQGFVNVLSKPNDSIGSTVLEQMERYDTPIEYYTTNNVKPTTYTQEQEETMLKDAQAILKKIVFGPSGIPIISHLK
jgi:hypothetical protein